MRGDYGYDLNIAAKLAVEYLEIEQYRRAGLRPGNIHVAFAYILYPIFAFDGAASGIACRKMLVVQYPHAHIALVALVQHYIHIAPPFFAHKIGVRARLDAERAYA